MQPEEIIQTKEWAQLSATEKDSVAPLADTEEEYNLLKNILLVAAEDIAVPAISPSVKAALQATLRPPRRMNVYWYAAASVLAAAVAAYFLLSPQKQPLVTVAVPVVDQIKPDTSRLVKAPVIPQPVVTQKNAVVVKKQQKRLPANKAKRRLIPIDTGDNTALVSVRLADHSSLLLLVTEVY